MTPSLRTMASGDVDAADQLVQAAFGSSGRRGEIERLLQLQPEGWSFAELDGAPAGAVSALEYGAFAYIGLMSVLPALHRRGIGLALMQRALAAIAAHGVPSVLLDATDAGDRGSAAAGRPGRDRRRAADREPAGRGRGRHGVARPTRLHAAALAATHAPRPAGETATAAPVRTSPASPPGDTADAGISRASHDLAAYPTG